MSPNYKSISPQQRKTEIISILAEVLANMPLASTVPHKKIPQNSQEKPLSCSRN
jgi:hypothetical protein